MNNIENAENATANRPMLGTRRGAHTFEITGPGITNGYLPFVATVRHRAPETLPLRDGRTARFVRSEQKPRGAFRLFYEA